MASLAILAHVLVEQRTNLRIATLSARRGMAGELARRIGMETGLAVTEGPRAAFDGRLAVWGTGPGTWLLIDGAADDDWLERLTAATAGAGSAIDQSSAYVVLQLHGVFAEMLLQKGLFVDLAQPQFPPGSCASGPIAHIPVIVARTGKDRFEVAVPRSYVGSFRHWLEVAGQMSDLGMGFLRRE